VDQPRNDLLDLAGFDSVQPCDKFFEETGFH
jgi:hypothetical protein